MKILFITDTHGMASVPFARLDDFAETVIKKMEYVGEYAKDINADLIIHGGDWIHTPDVSEAFIRRLSQTVSKYPCDVVGVLGNHDIYGYNPATFNRTSLGIAEGLNMFTRLGMEKPYIKGSAAITGCDAIYDLDEKDKINYYTETQRVEGKINIHVVHGMLVERVWPQVAKCTTICQVIENNPTADIILTGHEHTGYGVIREEVNGRKVLFCNPGSLLRVTSGTGDVRKDCRIAVINIDDDTLDFDIEFKNLPSSIARSANEIMDLEKVAEAKENKKQMQSFIQDMNKIETDNNIDVFDNLNKISKEENIDEEVVKECRTKIEQAQEELKVSE